MYLAIMIERQHGVYNTRTFQPGKAAIDGHGDSTVLVEHNQV